MLSEDFNQKVDLTKIPCKTTYFWDRKETGETILGSGGECVLNKTASKIWDLIDEKNSLHDIIQACGKRGITKKNVLEVIQQLEKTGNVSYLTSVWEL